MEALIMVFALTMEPAGLKEMTSCIKEVVKDYLPGVKTKSRTPRLTARYGTRT